MACTVAIGQSRYSGVILDLSATGLFVQTHAKPRPHEPLILELSVPGHREALRLQAVVTRLRVVPASLVNVAQGGVGLRITNAPEGYFAFLASILPERRSVQLPAQATGAEPATGARPRVEPFGAEPAARSRPRAPAAGPEPAGGDGEIAEPLEAPPAAGVRRYRVRVSQAGGARSRTLLFAARSPEEAAALAVGELGEGWRALESTEERDPAATRS
jgi:hypothetical protein